MLVSAAWAARKANQHADAPALALLLLLHCCSFCRWRTKKTLAHTKKRGRRRPSLSPGWSEQLTGCAPSSAAWNAWESEPAPRARPKRVCVCVAPAIQKKLTLARTQRLEARLVAQRRLAGLHDERQAAVDVVLVLLLRSLGEECGERVAASAVRRPPFFARGAGQHTHTDSTLTDFLAGAGGAILKVSTSFAACCCREGGEGA